MEYLLATGPLDTVSADCLVVGVYADASLSIEAKALDLKMQGRISSVVGSGAVAGAHGRTLFLFPCEGMTAPAVLLVSFGDRCGLDPVRFRTAVRSATDALRQSGVKGAAFLLSSVFPDGGEPIYWSVRHIVEAVDHSAYKYVETKSADSQDAALEQVVVWYPDNARGNAAREALGHAKGIAHGVALARRLGDLPANICTPAYLAEQARRLAWEDDKVKTIVIDADECARQGMGSFLSVAKGSDEPCQFIVMEYRNSGGPFTPHAMVGKGVTFDAGGLSIKASAGMDLMKFDMCGAASVFGAVAAVSKMALTLDLVGIIPATENLLNGRANKPGDVVTSMSGQTIEILNTDAEGRLILNDALTYAQHYRPLSLIDVASLTGACVAALGRHASGLMSTHDELAAKIVDAGTKSGDRVWRLPLWDDYQDQLTSNFADMANIGNGDAGAIVAACFLSRFATGQNWAHIDVAGTGWTAGRAQKGATGRPVALLVQYLIDEAEPQLRVQLPLSGGRVA